MYLEKAKEIIKNEYEKNLLLVTTIGKDLIEEKIRHTYQVLGAGNLILKNEPIYQGLSDDEIDLLKATVLLHDLGRFREAIEEGIDHGVYGAKLLESFEEFNNYKVRLAVKHHGHLIEYLYQDEEYCNLRKNEQEEVKKYIFLVRDADKIANFNLVANEFLEMTDLFFHPKRYNNCKIVSQKVYDDFMKHRSINKEDIKSVADHVLMFFACIFDLNYKSSFVFLDKLKIMEKLVKDCAIFWENNAKIYQDEILDFVKSKL